MVDGSICGLFSFGGIISSSYVIVFTTMYAITCVFQKSSMYNKKFWY